MLKEVYENKVISELLVELKAKNRLSVPKLSKIVVSMGVGNHKEDKDFLAEAFTELQSITGQAPVFNKARKAESGFKLRKGDTIGLQVTLRGTRMWDFLDRLIKVALPRVRDFRGVSVESFDGHGNYSMGLEEHQVFPEIDPNKMKRSKSLEVTLVTTAKVKDQEAFLLLKKLGMPFVKENING